MKMTIRFCTLALALIGSVLLTACRKEAPTLAEITIVDLDGNPFPAATVRVFGESTVSPHNEMIMDQTKITDLSGEVIFDFTKNYNLGQAGFAVLTIEVNSGDTLFGEGIIKIEEEKLNSETVVIAPL